MNAECSDSSFCGKGIERLFLFAGVVLLSILGSISRVQAQGQVARTVSGLTNCGGYYEYLPADYNSKPDKKYPLLLFLHGLGELGNGTTQLSAVLRNGPPKLINNGTFPKSFTVNGEQFSFIVISPQFKWFMPSSVQVEALMKYILNKYRVDESRIYVTGLSMGGGMTWNYAGEYGSKVAAIVTAAAAVSANADLEKKIADLDIRAWALHNEGDPTASVWGDKNMVSGINKLKPGLAKLTLFNSSSHDAWSKAYDPNFKEDGMNVYEWLLQFTRGGTSVPPPPANEIPVANAGSDITLTLPSNTTTLDGSGSKDTDGNIASYSWAAKSGPSQYTLANEKTATATISNLIAGTYVFELTVTDDKDAMSVADVTVTVNDAPASNETPVANAGSDITLTLPSNTATLDGSGSKDTDGNIASYSWTAKSGPSQYTLANEKTATATVSNLLAGTYVFELTVTDDKGATSVADVTVTVNDAPASNETPVANAGSDITLTLPSNTTTLDGSDSKDTDGNIASYSWTAKSGPSQYTLANEKTATATISNLIAGTYVFELTVTDDKGSIASSEVTVSVAGDPANQSLTANAGEDAVLYLPKNAIMLDGTGSTGRISSSKWTKVSGPVSYKIQNPNNRYEEVTGLVEGTYVFQITVKGYSYDQSTATVTITVKADTLKAGDVGYTANDKVPDYESDFYYGVNPGFYGNGYTDMDLSDIAIKAGAHSFRPSLPDYLVGKYGYDIRLNTFKYYYDSLGFRDNTLFIWSPRDEFRDTKTYGGCANQSKVFSNLYEPIWGDGKDGTLINKDNYFAVYVYNLVKRYGKYVKYWEVWNEPDITGDWRRALGQPNTGVDGESWWDIPPSPCSIYNLNAPIFYYIRMLRITYEIVKKVEPDDYVTTGGLGYPSFADNILRYTDNPDGGKVSAEYPLTGGAYFDILSYHEYPTYDIYHWDNAVGGFVYDRYSDEAVDVTIDKRDQFQAVLEKYGYNGVKYPKKDFILTEVNIAHGPVQDNIWTNEAQVNFAIKMLVRAQKESIRQVYFYQLGETADSAKATNQYQLMGLYKNLKASVKGAEKLTDEGVAFKTTSTILFGYEYDADRTNALNLPANIRGAAFKKGDEYRYVLWAKTDKDLSEVANAAYSFPAGLNIDTLNRYEWNYAVDGRASSVIAAKDIPLTGTPVFFTLKAVSDNLPPIANAGKDVTLSLPVDSIQLDGSASMDPDGTIASYKWTQVSGPMQPTINRATAERASLSKIDSGVYVFRLTVEDNEGSSASATVKITIRGKDDTGGSPNLAPTANAGDNITLALPSNTATLDGSASEDPDGTIAQYHWEKVSGPDEYILTNENNAKATLNDLVEGTYVFQLSVTDDQAASSNATVIVTVSPVINESPVATAGNGITISLPTDTTTLDGSDSKDADGTIVKYSWEKISGPEQFELADKNAARTKLSGLVEGTYIFQLTITDDQGATSNAKVIITVNPATNQSPVANAGSDLTLILPTDSTALDGSASKDADGSIAKYSWEKISGPEQFELVNRNAVETKLSGLVEGTYVFQLTVTDDHGATAIDDIIITVSPAINQPPVADAGSDLVLTLPSDSTVMDGSASKDADGTIVKYSWEKVSGPEGYTLTNGNTAKASLASLVEGTYIFQITVADDHGAVSNDKIIVTVNPAENQSPEVSIGGDIMLTLPENTTTLDGSASKDPDGSIAKYNWEKVSGPEQYALTNEGAAKATLNDLVEGTYVFQLTVTDNQGATAKSSLTITVNPAKNILPVANAGNDITLTLPSNNVTLDGSASKDADGKIAKYSWEKISGPVQYTLVNEDSVKAALSNLVEGTYVFQLTVTDDQGAAAKSGLTITVNPNGNQSPLANAGSGITLTLPSNSATLDGSASKDPDGTITKYKWEKISGPAQYTLSDEDASKATLSNLVEGTYVFGLTVTDDKGSTSTDRVTLNIEPLKNELPVANAGANIVLTLPSNSTTLSGSASKDADGTIAKYGWTKVSGPAQYTLTNESTSKASLSNLVEGTYVFQLTVTDNQGATSTDKVIITVNPAKNQPPVSDAGNGIVLTLPSNSTTLSGSVSKDADGTIAKYNWTKVSGPAQYTLTNESTSKASLSNLVEGTYVFQLTVTDDQGATSTDKVIITVNPAKNQPPVSDAGNGIVLTLPSNSTILNGIASKDADGTIAKYGWTKVSGPAQYTLTNESTSKASLSNLVEGTYVFQLTVTDNQGATSTDKVIITVNPAKNQPPVSDAGNGIVLTLPSNSTTLSGSASKDADGTIAKYNWTKVSGPAQYTLTNESTSKALLSNLLEGTYVFQLTVTDNQGATSTDKVIITVNPAKNQPPVSSAGSNITLTLPVNSAELDGSASKDPDGAITKYKWEKISGPAQYALTNENAVSATLSNLVEGTYVFQLTVTDGQGATSTDKINIVVNPAKNQPPVANAGSSINLTLPANSATLDGSASKDPDGKIVKYNWTKISGPGQYDLANEIFAKATLSNLMEGAYVFQLTVTDDEGATNSARITVTVSRGANQPPVADAGQPFSIALPRDSVQLSGYGSIDPDGDVLTYQWQQLSGVSNATIENSTAVQTVIHGLKAGEYEFALTVTDDKGAKSQATVRVTVLEDKAAPKLMFRVFPNPVHDQLKVKFNRNSTGLIMFRFIDEWGRIVKTVNYGYQPQHLNTIMDVSELQPGIYFLELLENDRMVETKKVIKVK